MSKKIPQLITEGFLPDENTYRLLTERKGIPRNYIGSHIVDFIDYWIIKGTKRASWQLTFIKRVKAQWEYDRHNIHRDYDLDCSFGSDFFRDSLAHLGDKPKDRRQSARPISPIESNRATLNKTIKPLTKEERTKLADKYLSGLNKC